MSEDNYNESRVRRDVVSHGSGVAGMAAYEGYVELRLFFRLRGDTPASPISFCKKVPNLWEYKGHLTCPRAYFSYGS